MRRALMLLAVGLLAWAGWIAAALAQQQAATGSAVEATVAPMSASDLLSTADLDRLVAPVALYPDPLLSLIMQAATLPLQIVQADRFLSQLQRDPKQQPPSDWDASVLGLLNYPPVVHGMSQQLDWTQKLGDAVLGQLADVQASIQQVRAEIRARGGLVSDDKNQVIVADGVIQIVPADPDKIYIPRYDYTAAADMTAAPDPGAATPPAQPPIAEAPAPEVPAAAPAAPAIETPAPPAEPAAPTTVVVQQPAYPAPYGYSAYAPPTMAYSDPYPSYASSAATFIGGAFVGGIIGYAIGDDDDDVNVHLDGDGYRGGRDVNVSGNTVNVIGSNNRRASATDVEAQLRARNGTTAVARRGDSVSATGLAPAKRPAISAVAGSGASPRVNAQARARSARQAPVASAVASGSRNGGLGEVTSARQTRQATNRAQRSRNSAIQSAAAPRGASVTRSLGSSGGRAAKAGGSRRDHAFSGISRGDRDGDAGRRGAGSRKGRGGGKIRG